MDRKAESARMRNAGANTMRLDGFSGKDGWRFRVSTGGWSSVVEAYMTIRGLYGMEWKVLRGPSKIGVGALNKEGLPMNEAWIAGEWPGRTEKGIRTALVPDDIEGTLELSEPVQSAMELEVFTKTR